MPQAATPSSVRVRWMNWGGRLAPPGGEGRVEIGDVVLGAGGLDAGEDVDGPVAEFEASVKIRLDIGQSMPSTMRKSRSTPSERATSASR